MHIDPPSIMTVLSNQISSYSIVEFVDTTLVDSVINPDENLCYHL